jgi:hypothetical protein
MPPSLSLNLNIDLSFSLVVSLPPFPSFPHPSLYPIPLYLHLTLDISSCIVGSLPPIISLSSSPSLTFNPCLPLTLYPPFSLTHYIPFHISPPLSPFFSIYLSLTPLPSLSSPFLLLLTRHGKER